MKSFTLNREWPACSWCPCFQNSEFARMFQPYIYYQYINFLRYLPGCHSFLLLSYVWPNNRDREASQKNKLFLGLSPKMGGQGLQSQKRKRAHLPEVFALLQQWYCVVFTPAKTLMISLMVLLFEEFCKTFKREQYLEAKGSLASLQTPVLYIFVLPFVLWDGWLPEVCFARELKTFLHRTKKLSSLLVQVLQWGHYVSRTCQCLD